MLYNRKPHALFSFVVLFFSNSALSGGGGDLHTCLQNVAHSSQLRTHNGHCYEFKIDRGITWNEAESDCRKHGGNLVSVNSPDEQQFLLSTLLSMWFHGDHIWIGLTDAQREGSFVWVSGETLSFKNWAWGQPDQSKHGKKRFILPHLDEDCVVMRYLEWGHWYDVPCGRSIIHPGTNPYICEYAPITHTPSHTTPVPMTSSASPATTTRHADTPKQSTEVPKTTVSTVLSSLWVTLRKRRMLPYRHQILNKS